MTITIHDIEKYQDKKKEIKTIGEFKSLGRELRNKFSLTDRQSIDILNGNDQAILDILAIQEESQ